ncbi:MAG: hypothetical protein J6P73_03080 [Bacteroidales bacterium]|nr:hypothetical protein [Bacteroidales bacterium]
MKKVLITMTVLASMMAGAMVFSSFTTQEQGVKEESMQLCINDPTYWEGIAWYPTPNKVSGIYISVYQTRGQCNSYYAIITDTKSISASIGAQLWVKENPNYDPYNSNDRQWWKNCKYYVTSGTSDFYFNM